MKATELGKAPSVVVIGGPTACGKSALAVRLAETFDGTVINGDALQVYRELSVLTARPGSSEARRAPHRLYGVLSVHQPCSAARWRTMALAAIAAAHGRGRLPIVVGGTGLYLRALMEGLSPVPAIDPEVRRSARSRHAELGAERFHAELSRLDPVMGKRLQASDSQRVIRAWEVITATGRSLSLFQKIRPAKPALRFVPLVILPPREALVAACDRRAARMLEEGALDEVKALLAMQANPSLPAMKAVGVRELGEHLAGRVSRQEALEALQRATRQYAKRQITWFRRQMPEAQIWREQFSESLELEIFPFIRKSVDRPTAAE
ncbi:MAG: tRNA (adenosine(37)-N6)-dimethylallyltransferase MiaA [Alphaproteobacteria bacterium]|nr:tRNA (adenosine(37)-N6)-dimethylallyltransferase MiaA [Alphaproteobacteria bacterium]